MSSVVDEILAQGRQKAKKEVARRMLTNGKLSLEEIAECSGLSIDEVKQLQNEKSA